MERIQKRKRDVFFVGDLLFAATAFTFVHYNFSHGMPVFGGLLAVGGLIFLGLAAVVYCKHDYLQTASWIFVILSTGFMIYAMFFFNLHMTNVIWMTFPYFLSMLLLGLRSGTIVSLVYLVASITAVFTHFSVMNDSISRVNQISISLACACAFAFAAYYEKARSKNEEELLRKNCEIETMSHLDGLTGLFNRRFFDRALHQEFSRAKRERQSVALIFLDIDHFKKYNDTFGHLKGDACLGEVADAINAAITRSTDTATRFGGDEFAVLLPNTERDGAQYVADRIMHIIAQKAIPHTSSGVAGIVTISLGIALLSQDEDRVPADLVRRADRALYKSKESGRNKATFA